MTVHDAIATVERELRNYHDSGCFIYLPSGSCDCGMSPPVEALEALKRVKAEVARLERELHENDRLVESAWAERDRETEKAKAAESEIARLRDGLRLADALADRFEAMDTRAHDFGRANELVAYRDWQKPEDGAALEQSGTCGPGCWPGHDCDITSLAEDDARLVELEDELRLLRDVEAKARRVIMIDEITGLEPAFFSRDRDAVDGLAAALQAVEARHPRGQLGSPA